METKVLLIRHGETEWNRLGRFQGGTDIPLSKEGILQAKLLGTRINGEFDVIYSSPLIRAFETAKIISENYNKEIIIENQIREINFGEWEGLTINEIAQKYGELFRVWKTDKLEGNIKGGDLSIHNAVNRAKNSIIKLANDNKGKKLIIVAHGGIIKAGLMGIFGWDMTMYHKIALGNTCINTIKFDDNMNPVLLYLNDINHLNNNPKSV